MSAFPQEPGIHFVSGPEEIGTFSISIPRDYQARYPSALVISLHYAGSGRFYGSGLLGDVVEPGLRELGAIMVAPDCQAGLWNNPQSEKQVLSLLDLIAASYNIHPGRGLITGYSIGGIGAWYMASRHQDRFAAAIPMAAKPPSDAAEMDWRMPLFVLHGEVDELFPLAATVETVQKMRDAGAEVAMTVVEGVSHYETGRFFRPLREVASLIAGLWSASEGEAQLQG